MISYKRKRNREVPHVRNTIKEGPNLEVQERETQSMGFRLMDLPSSIIIEVLKKMPTKEVLQCRCTCTTLGRLIFDPYFANHFLSRSQFSSIVYHRFPGNHIKYSRLDGGRIGRGRDMMEHVSKRHIPQGEDLELVGSSKGIVCVWNKSSNANALYITNPVLGESAVLPKPLGDKFSAIDETYWFGYIPTTGIFKAIRIKVRRALLQSNPRQYFKKSEAQVLAIGTDKWKCVGDVPFPRDGKFCKTVLNGCLHWLVGDDNDSIQLHSFNMVQDRAHSFPPPMLGSKGSCIVELEVVGNYLCVIRCIAHPQQIEFWFMKDYGVASSWTKDIVISNIPTNPGPGLPATFWKGTELTFFWCIGGLFVTYDPEEKKYCGSFNLAGKRKGNVWIYTPSLLSLTRLGLGARLRVNYTKSYHTKLTG